ncbi:hypothetical protein OG308_19305 [Nocardia salmonicida]|uniref:Polyketide cyclase n=1 Tax=Nocardia salmonicida TaxID=53431 RepID=A0ABZ1N0M3_9NOCA
MTDTVTRSINHAQFTIEREVPVAPAVVFQAFADPAVKAKWFGGEEGWEQARSLSNSVPTWTDSTPAPSVRKAPSVSSTPW